MNTNKREDSERNNEYIIKNDEIKNEDIISRIKNVFTFNPNSYSFSSKPNSNNVGVNDSESSSESYSDSSSDVSSTASTINDIVNESDDNQNNITQFIKNIFIIIYYILIFFIWFLPSRIVFVILFIIAAIPYGLYLFLLNYPDYGLYILLGLIILMGTLAQLIYYVPKPHPTHKNNNQTSTSCPTQTNPLLSMSMPTTASNTAPRSINKLSMNVGQQEEPTPQYKSDMISELITETVGLNETYEKMYDSRNIDMRKSFYETISIQILEKWRNVLFIVYFLALLFYSFIIFASGNLTIFEKIKKIIIALIVTNIYFIKFVIITVYWLYNYVSGGTLFG
jgi:hypothetical protein